VSRFPAWLLAAFLLGLGAPARAQEPDSATRASARALGDEANALYAQGDFAGALDRYNRAAALVDVPTVHVRAARCLKALGRLVDAAERYRAIVRKGAPADALEVHRDAVQQASQELAALEPTIPWVVLDVTGYDRDVEVTVDGVVVVPALIGVRRAIDPGDHVARVRRDAAQNDKPFHVDAGQTQTVTIEAPPAPAGPAPPPVPAPTFTPMPLPPPDRGDTATPVQIPIGWALVGVGGAGLVTGLVLVGVTASKHGALVDACGEDLDCLPADHEDADSYNTLRVATTAMLVAGGAVAAVGVVLVVTAPSGDTVALRLGPTHAGIAYRF
jgi:hypothetical protein